MYAEPLGNLGSVFKKIRKVIPKPIKKVGTIAFAPYALLTPGGRKVIGKITPKPIIKIAKGAVRIQAGLMTGGASELIYLKRKRDLQRQKKKDKETRLAPIRQEAALRAAIEQDKLEAKMEAEIKAEMKSKEEQETIDSNSVNRVKSVLSSVPLPYLFIGGMVVVGMLLSRR